jgi:hypothetical protein
LVKTIETLTQDIYALFGKEPHVCDEANLEILGRGISDMVGRRLSEVRSGKGSLRMSNLDKPDRQLWYEIRTESTDDLPPSAKIKFLFGDILEELLLFLAVEAGHDVFDRQKEIVVDGIRGSIDCTVDGVLVDCKSASSQSFKNFSDKLTPGLFSYSYQVSGYVEGTETGRGGLLVIDKQLGHIALFIKDKKDLPDVKSRIEHLKKVVAQETPPERCYSDEPDGKSGNRKLGVGCSYCNHKFVCWDNLRVFQYSTGPRYMTRIIREPDVFETRS